MERMIISVWPSEIRGNQDRDTCCCSTRNGGEHQICPTCHIDVCESDSRFIGYCDMCYGLAHKTCLVERELGRDGLSDYSSLWCGECVKAEEKQTC